jgi:3-isopropylmalate/(R)-2-methylmalate dehydratase small subunit
MEAFKKYTGRVAPMDRINVDTDLIIPKQFLKSIKRSGFGVNLFDPIRYLDEGQPDTDNSNRPLNPDFVLNQERYKDVSILLARQNFGCGSSREHAPWALLDYGFKAIIAPSFADIFFTNCLKNGLLPIALSEEQVAQLFNELAAEKGYALEIDLEEEKVVLPDGTAMHFSIDPFQKHCLLNGLDQIAITLEKSDAITEYEKRRSQSHPWLFADVS